MTTAKWLLVPPILTALCSLAIAEGAVTRNPGLRHYYDVPPANPPQNIKVEVCVFGATPGGVAAAVQAGRMGKKTALAIFRRHVGGMTSGGLSAVDLGITASIGGMTRDYFGRLSPKFAKTKGDRKSVV
jgi:hypothetical protein